MLVLRFILDRDVINVVASHCNGTNSFVDGQGGSMWFSLYLSTWIWVEMPYGEYLRVKRGRKTRNREWRLSLWSACFCSKCSPPCSGK